MSKSRTLTRERGIKAGAWSRKSGLHTEGRQVPRRKGRASKNSFPSHFLTVFIRAGCALSTVLILNKLSIIDKIIDYRLSIKLSIIEVCVKIDEILVVGISQLF